jgi:hypothetical protein
MQDPQIKYLIETFNDFKDAAEAHRDKTDDKLEKILVQTTKTNGRVYRLEEKEKELFSDVKMLNETKQSNKGRDGVLLFILSTTIAILTGYIIYILSQHK